MLVVNLVIENEKTPKCFANQSIDIDDIVSSKRVKPKRKRTTDFPLYPLVRYFRTLFRQFYPVPELKSFYSLLLNLVVLFLEIIIRLRLFRSWYLFKLSLLNFGWPSFSDEELFKVGFYICLLFVLIKVLHFKYYQPIKS